jgi:hypothetical protein
MKTTPHLEPRTVALILGLSVGLGIVVHEAFFLVAIGVATMAVAEAVHKHDKTTHTHP